MAAGPIAGSPNTFTAKELTERFSPSKLPPFLFVEEGFYVPDSADLSVAQGDVLQLHGLELKQCLKARVSTTDDSKYVLIPMEYPGKVLVEAEERRFQTTWDLAKAHPRPRKVMSTRQYPSLFSLEEAPVEPFVCIEILDETIYGIPLLRCRLPDKPDKPVVYLPLDFEGQFQEICDQDQQDLTTIKEALGKHSCPLKVTFNRGMAFDEVWSGSYLLEELCDVPFLVCSALLQEGNSDSDSDSEGDYETVNLFFIPTLEDDHDARFKPMQSLSDSADWLMPEKQIDWEKVGDIFRQSCGDQHRIQGIVAMGVYVNVAASQNIPEWYKVVKDGNSITSHEAGVLNITDSEGKPMFRPPGISSSGPAPCLPEKQPMNPAPRLRDLPPKPPPRPPPRLPNHIPQPPPSPTSPSASPKPKPKRVQTSAVAPIMRNPNMKSPEGKPCGRVRPSRSPVETTTRVTTSNTRTKSHDSTDGDADGYLTPVDLTRAPSKRASVRIMSIDDIPEDLRTLSVEELTASLRLLNLPQVAQVCEAGLVDGDMFMALEEEDFKLDPFKLSGLPFKKVVRVLKGGWRPRRKTQK